MLLTSDSFETADLPLPLEIDAMRSPPTFRVFHALARYERFEEISDRRDFRNNYEEVGVIAADSLDDVFAATNDDRREYLESVRPGAEIRSTSVGDVIMEAWADERYGASVFNGSLLGKFFGVDRFGFSEVRVVFGKVFPKIER